MSDNFRGSSIVRLIRLLLIKHGFAEHEADAVIDELRSELYPITAKELRFRNTPVPIIDESCLPASSDVRIRTRVAIDESLDPRSEHRISRSDRTAVLFGIDGGQPTGRRSRFGS